MVKLKDVLKDLIKAKVYVTVDDIFGIPVLGDDNIYSSTMYLDMLKSSSSYLLSVEVVGIRPERIKIAGLIDTIVYLITLNIDTDVVNDIDK